ncbi:MAG: ABC transporter permease [Planctomycetes bacterium]|nr:ABC transporter permease [Planctomycetota bacterium]
MSFFKIRGEAPRWETLLYAALCVALCLGLWWYATRGAGEERILSPALVPSPAETFAAFSELWSERALARNIGASLRRVALGFGLAALVGVPLGVLCGCFTRLNAFFSPLSIFGRNIPIAALIPLTFYFFGIGEMQKVMFIFIACVAFVISDTARAVLDVGGEYIDTAYTLGARRREVILKVLFPLALPSIFNSLRLLFGIAFGYIMLAEVVKSTEGSGGLGDIINISQRRGTKEHILLVLLIIPVVALALDKCLFWIQKELFPHRYGGRGLLNRCVRACIHRWEDLKGVFWRSGPQGDER